MLLFIRWNVSPDIFSFHGLALHYYSLMFVIAFFLGYKILLQIFRKEKMDENLAGYLLVYVGIATLAGARLGDCFFYDWGYYQHHLLEIVLPVETEPDGKIIFIGYRGLASHGGAIGIFIACLLYCSKYKTGFLWLMDRLSIVIALAGVFIRLGNLFNSEIIGTPTNVPWAFIFERVDMVPRHPSQLYESFCYLFIFVILYRLYLKKKKRQAGYLFGIFLITLFAVRFVIEFWKQNQETFENSMPLDMGQLLSIPFIIAGAVLVFLKWNKRKYNEVPDIQ